MQAELWFRDPRELIQFMRGLEHPRRDRVGELIELIGFFVRTWTYSHPLEPIKGFKVIVAGDDIKVFAKTCVEIFTSVCSIMTVDLDSYTPRLTEP